MAYSEEDNSTLRLLSASFVIQVRSMTHGSFFTHVVMNETVLIGFLKPSFSLLLGSLDVNKEFILHLYCSFLGTTNFNVNLSKGAVWTRPTGIFGVDTPRSVHDERNA